MKKFGATSLSIAIISTTLFVGSFVFRVEKLVSNAAVVDWQKGASINSTSPTDFASDSFKQSVKNLRATGANTVSLIIPYWQPNDQSSDIALAQNGPTDQTLIAAINYIHSLGMQVMLKPHLDSGSGIWRATISPTDRDAWYGNYSAMLNHLGDIGKQTHVEIICMGTEMIYTATYTSNPDNTQRWITMINSLRTHFPGKLTYGANWGPGGVTDEKSHIGFWSNLDYIGLSAYFNLNTSSTDYESLKNAWDTYRVNEIEPLYNQYKKPVLFTELGYRAVPGAHNQPWNYSSPGMAYQQEQADDYTALFKYWDNYPYMMGVELWNWSSDPNAGGANSNEYTPQHKLAESVMATWFQGKPVDTTQTPVTPAPPIVPVNPTTTIPVLPVTRPDFISVPNIISTATVGDKLTLTIPITNRGSGINNTIVGIGIADAHGKDVKQQFFGGQNFASGMTQSYSLQWTPETTGAYKIYVSVFDAVWNRFYDGSNVAHITVNAASASTPTQPTNTTDSKTVIPSATTLPASVSGANANIAGAANMNGGSGHVWFEYGTNPKAANYSEAWPWAAAVRSISGNGTNTINFLLTNLPLHTTYYYRIVVENEVDALVKTYGKIMSFRVQ
jgi:hypothetical protein